MLVISLLTFTPLMTIRNAQWTMRLLYSLKFFLRSNQINVDTFVHQMGDVCISNLVEQIAIFIWFELGTSCTPFIGSYPSIVALCHWHSFFAWVGTYLWDTIVINCNSLGPYLDVCLQCPRLHITCNSK